MEIIDREKILHELIMNTGLDILVWREVSTYSGYNSFLTYKATKILTRQKSVEFIVYVATKRIEDSYMMLHFVLDQNLKTHIATINYRNNGSLKSLIDLLNSKKRVGKIK